MTTGCKCSDGRSLIFYILGSEVSKSLLPKCPDISAPDFGLNIGAEVSKWFGAEVSGHFGTGFVLNLVPKCPSALVPKCPDTSASFLWCRSVLWPKCPAPGWTAGPTDSHQVRGDWRRLGTGHFFVSFIAAARKLLVACCNLQLQRFKLLTFLVVVMGL